MASLGTLSLLVLITTVNSQQPIVSPNTISAGGTFTAYCDASRVTTPTPSSNDIITLRVSRMTAGSTAYTDIAQYSGNIIPSNQSYQNIPSDRKWNITFSGLNGAQNNKDTMKLVWDVYDARCDDAGTYQCTVTYFINSNQLPYSNTQNVTAISGISGFSLNVNPPGLEYGEDNITFTCQFYGPETVKPQWELWTPNPFNGEYTLNRGIIEAVTEKPVPQSSSGGCSQFLIVSTLNIQLTSYDNQNMYKCIVKTNSQEESSNMTISVLGSKAPQPQTAAGADVGMIVGVVIGCVAAIVIIIIIVFFVVRYRKRSKGDNYKDNQDQPDAGNDNLHAPPPVFYPSTKPSKGSKDEKDSKIPTGMTNDALDTSYDSRDSGNRGPPQYVNTELEERGPPHYEKETHRGRHNKGYDEEDRDRNGGHGRRQPREREERKPRSRGYDDEPSRRKYSTDDGTDGRVNMGDPNIGTSI